MNLLGIERAQLSVFLQLTSLFNAALHMGTFQNCNFHVVNNFSKYGSE